MSERVIRLSVPEVRKLLLAILMAGRPTETQTWHWSRWRRQHQYRAKHHHYRRRGERMPKDDLQL